jgi:hypothetical protein
VEVVQATIHTSDGKRVEVRLVGLSPVEVFTTNRGDHGRLLEVDDIDGVRQFIARDHIVRIETTL